jgi:hypothetical protein
MHFFSNAFLEKYDMMMVREAMYEFIDLWKKHLL